MSRCSILRRVTVIGNVTVSAKSKFLVVALENVALLHSPKVYWKLGNVIVSAKSKFLVVALENVAMFHFVEGISKGVPLRHAFRIFPRERKDTAVWSAQLHEREIC